MNDMNVDIVIIGAGPAGLCAALEAAKSGASVCVLDENKQPGGQLFKQIHKFFGSEVHSAGTRGFRIAQRLVDDVNRIGVNVLLDTIAWGIFPGFKIGATTGETETFMIEAKKVIVATGAAENTLLFEGSTLPGVVGAGAAQTIMNIHKVVPGRRALVVGSGNVGLIVSYQLMQAGVEVVGLVEAANAIGGYMVHASKIRRAGVPIYLGHTILEAKGDQCVTHATVARLDEKWQVISGSERDIAVDLVCLAVGLHPMAELCWMLGCEFDYSKVLGGHVPMHDQDMQTSVNGLYIAGDVSGIEEASVAMEEGRLAGVAAAQALGYIPKLFAEDEKAEINQHIADLREGTLGCVIADEKQRIMGKEAAK